MTDRDEQIKEIVNLAIDGIDALVKFWDNENEAREDFEAVKETLKPILALLQDSKPCDLWIPVSERLPENIRDVWIVLKAKATNSYVADIGFYGEDENGYKWEIYGKGLLTEVTHWQPIVLPQKQPCKTCGGSGEKMVFDGENGCDTWIPCPDCGEKGD